MKNERLNGYLSVLAAIFLFSTLEVAGKYIQHLYGPDEIDHFQLALVRFIFGGLFMLVVLAGRRRLDSLPGIVRGDTTGMALLGVIGVYVTFTLYFWGLEKTQASTAAVIFCVNPVFTAVLAYPLLHEKARLRTWLGAILGLAGAFLAITGMDFSNFAVRAELGGGLAVLASALSWSLYTVMGKKYTAKYGETEVSFISIVIGSVLFLATVVIRGDMRGLLDLHPATWLICLYIGVFTVGVAYIFYFWGMNKVPTASGASFFFLKPSLAVLLAWAVLGEDPGHLVIPVLLSSAGIFLSTWRSRPEEWIED